jgi:hypothetical protein
VIVGAHAIVYSTNPDADRAFLREVIGLPNVDVGGGWLIFGLPPSEVAVHPAEQNGGQELYLLVKDVKEFVNAMRRRKIACSPIHTERWGHVTNVTLPGGGALGVYQPLHARPPVARTAARRIAASRRTRKATKTQRRR